MKKSTQCCPLLLLLLVLFSHHAASTPQRPSIGSGGVTSACPETCPDSFRPVCGSDNKAYRNECVFRLASCQNSNLLKVNDGPCVRKRPVSADALPSLAPPPRQPTSSDSQPCNLQCRKIFLPVCGTDGKTYSNPCHLESESCLALQKNPSSRPITQRREGACENDNLPAPPSGPPTNPCYRRCSGTYVPICGTNGETYHNKCELNVANCLSESIRQRYEGPCAVQSDASSSSSSGGLRPSINLAVPIATRPADSRPASVVNADVACDSTCTGGLRPVCGSDGKTYASDCLLSVARCKNPNLIKRDDGVCSKDCSLVCYEEYAPVCGSNGVVYLNDCYLTVARCKDDSIRKAADSFCADPIPDACRRQCNNEDAPICGSDGFTYVNICHLQAAACNSQNAGLVQLYPGRCSQ